MFFADHFLGRSQCMLEWVDLGSRKHEINIRPKLFPQPYSIRGLTRSCLPAWYTASLQGPVPTALRHVELYSISAGVIVSVPRNHSPYPTCLPPSNTVTPTPPPVSAATHHRPYLPVPSSSTSGTGERASSACAPGLVTA